MSSESDCALDGKAMTAARKHRHEVWHRWNMRKIMRKMAGRFTVANGGECVMFREKGFPKVDFYPSTGRYRSQNKTRGGHFDEFYKWYVKQEVNP